MVRPWRDGAAMSRRRDGHRALPYAARNVNVPSLPGVARLLLLIGTRGFIVPNRAILFAVGLSVAASCSETHSEIARTERADASARSEFDAGADTVADEADSAAIPECQLISPPRLVLSSEAGEQEGLGGSYCGGACPAPRCADRPFSVWSFTVLHPGDELAISAPEAQLLPGPGCQPACPPRARIAPWCDRKQETATLEFDEDVAWPLELPEGTYAVEITTHVDAENGWRGSVEYGFGLIVAASRPRAIVDSADFDPECAMAND
jgi:hypothetical protein